MLMAGIICAHFDVAPQPLLPQLASEMSLFIEPDASWMMRMSGGSLASGCCTIAQFIPVTAAWPFWAAPPPTRPVPFEAPVPSGVPAPDEAPAPPVPEGAKPQPAKPYPMATSRPNVATRAFVRGIFRPPKSLVGGTV